jgi:hypothetical protein
LYRNSASPANNDDLGALQFKGQDAGGDDPVYVQIHARILDNTSSTADGALVFSTLTDGAIVEYFYLGTGLYSFNATGGDKGPGTINADAVYDDNTILSCYPFDQYLDGTIDPDKWDAKVPDKPVIDAQTGELVNRSRIHAPMRKFAVRIGTEYDPLTLDGYAKHWQDKRHLTSMPNEAKYESKMDVGSWVQRMIETVEIQAILIEQLNQKIKTVETRPL